MASRGASRRGYGSKALSSRKATGALAMLLSACRIEQLRGFTAEGLAGSWNVPVAECEQMLAAARAARERML